MTKLETGICDITTKVATTLKILVYEISIRNDCKFVDDGV